MLEESLAKLYFQQMSSAISYLHDRKICHRDLKPENILLCSSEDQDPVLKLTDLGLSKLVDQTILKTFCGTEVFMAPEMWKKAANEREDCWALVSTAQRPSHCILNVGIIALLTRDLSLYYEAYNNRDARNISMS